MIHVNMCGADTFFSPAESKVLEVLGRRKMTIMDLADEFYRDKPMRSPNNAVASALNKINKKCVFHNLDFIIDGGGSGRACRTVWKAKRR